jgi:hypothetical protein
LPGIGGWSHANGIIGTAESRTAVHGSRDPEARDPHGDGESDVGAPALAWSAFLLTTPTDLTSAMTFGAPLSCCALRPLAKLSEPLAVSAHDPFNQNRKFGE